MHIVLQTGIGFSALVNWTQALTLVLLRFNMKSKMLIMSDNAFFLKQTREF